MIPFQYPTSHTVVWTLGYLCIVAVAVLWWTRKDG